MGFAPPNSLAGFRNCVLAGAEGIECDITLIGGKPFVWSGDMDGSIDVPASSLESMAPAEIRSLRRRDCPEKILTIENVWNFLDTRPNVKVYFDVKYYGKEAYLPTYPIDFGDITGACRQIPDGMIRSVLETVIRPCPFQNRIGFVTFSGGLKLLQAAKEFNPAIRRDLIVILPWPKAETHFDCLSSVTIGWKNFNQWKFFSRRLAEILRTSRERGLETYAGVANSIDEVGWAIERGFEGIWTDNVPSTQTILATKRRAP